MTEDEYRSQLDAFLAQHLDLARAVIRAGLAQGQPADYSHICIETDAISSGVPFFLSHVTESSAEFEAAPRPEGADSEFILPAHLMPDLWDEEPEERYRIAGEAILDWVGRAFDGVETEKPCYAAERDNYRIYDLRTKEWVEKGIWH